MMYRAAFLPLLFAAGGALAQAAPAPAEPAASAASAPQAASPAAAAPDVQQSRTLQEALRLLRARRPQQAILAADEVIEYYASRQRNSPQKVFCARTAAEARHYLETHARANPGQDALVVRNWCDAYYIKGYALVDLRQLPEARVAIEAALALAPANAQYHAELAAIHSVEKNWEASLASYAAAEAAAEYSEGARTMQLARIHRGAGAVLLEMKRYDEAAQRYQRSLDLEPDNAQAKRQLEVIRDRAKSPS